MPTHIPEPMAQASEALRQVLLRLDSYAKKQIQYLDPSARYAPAVIAHVKDLESLLTAVEQYEQAVLASLTPEAIDVCALSPSELLAHREADPVYRLGWVRGYKAGQVKGQRSVEAAVQLYSRYSQMPEPTHPPVEHADLVARVRRVIESISQNYKGGVLPHPAA